MSILSVNETLAGLSAGSDTAGSRANEAGSADRFLKLLVAQMQNQDPLNPMDNAQVTSQMAQINTVNGIEKLDLTMKGLSHSLVQMQALQGASLVGRDITLEGNMLNFAGGAGIAGFELLGTADRVQVEILNGAGRVVDRLDLGTQVAGRHGFEWIPPDETDTRGYSFRVLATAGVQAVSATPLMLDRVFAVRTVGDELTLETLHSGSVPYSQVRAVN